jgi:hypothetical protein
MVSSINADITLIQPWFFTASLFAFFPANRLPAPENLYG